jgi:hypothetical protein
MVLQSQHDHLYIQAWQFKASEDYDIIADKRVSAGQMIETLAS